MTNDKLVTYRDPLSALAMFDDPIGTDTFKEFCDVLRQDVASGSFDPAIKDDFNSLSEEDKVNVIKMTATSMLQLYERSQFAFPPIFSDYGADVEEGADQPAPEAKVEVRVPPKENP